MKLFFFSLILSLNSLAKSDFAAPFSAVHTANCLEAPFNESESKIELEKTLQAGDDKLVHAGFKFEHETMISSNFFRTLISEEILKKLSTHESFEQRIRDAKSCEDSTCALTILFDSKENLTRTYYLISNFSLNVSPYANRDADLLETSDLDTIIVATRLIPKHMLPIWDNKRVAKHIKTGIGYYATFMIYANASIDLYTPWFKELSDDGKSYSIFHEFSHNLSYMMNMTDSSAWHALSKWQDTPNGWRYDKTKFVSEYAGSAPSEDAAESIVAYRINPELLKDISIQKYNFIRDYIFLGEEFDNVNKCGKTPVLSYMLKALRTNTSEEVSSGALKRCQNEFKATLLSSNDYVKFEDCMKTSLAKEIILASKYPHFLDAKGALLSRLNVSPKINARALKDNLTKAYHEISSYLLAKAKSEKTRDCSSTITSFSDQNEKYLGQGKYGFTWDLRSHCYKNSKTMKKKGLQEILKSYLENLYHELLKKV